MTIAAKPAGRERGLVRDRDFQLFRGSDLVSQLGAEMMLFALPLVRVSTLNTSGTQIGLLEAFSASTARACAPRRRPSGAER